MLRSRLIQRGQTCLHFSLKLEQDNTRYTMPQLIQLRRQMLRFARSLPPGPERNGRPAEGRFINTIKLDGPDDASATESARQFIDGLDIEPWQLDRKVATFEHKPK